MEENKCIIYQDIVGNYLSDGLQPMNKLSINEKEHNSTRYIHVYIGKNGVAMINTLDGNMIECARQLPQLYQNREDCCGCGACYAVCPQSGPNNAVRENDRTDIIKYTFATKCKEFKTEGAITMLPDEEGFYYPVVDAVKCVRCYKCMDVCCMKKDF